MTAEKDVDILVHDKFFKDKSEPGVFVEVGAALPDYLSISARFRDLGWKIVAIEPNPEFCQAHRSRGHQIYEYACSDVDADDMDFFVVDFQGADYLGGSVSFEFFLVSRHKRRVRRTSRDGQERTRASRPCPSK